MKVEVHDLKHQKWFVEAEPSDTIAAIKERNYEEHGIDRALVQKMIYSGKISKDSDTLESSKYAEGKGFIVCMATKARKPAAKPVKEESAAAPASTNAASAANTGANQETATSDASNAPNTGPLVPSAESGFVSGPSALATGSQLSAIVANIMEMGYTRQQVSLAMNRAYNNPDRAVEYLVTGQIPDVPEGSAPNESENDGSTSATDSGAASATETPPQAGGTAASSRASSVGANTASNSETNANALSNTHQGTSEDNNNSIDRDSFDAADRQMQMEEEAEADEVEEEIDFQQLLGLDDQQLEELRAAVRQNPTHLSQILDPIVRQNSAVAETLINNLDQFLWYMTSPEERDAIASGQMYEPGSEGAPEGSHVISSTEDEDAAVHRSMELGFEWEDAVTAYLACDKDEESTANYLFEHGNDDMN